jgi:hypothetical protein
MREGVYQQGIFGVFEDKHVAIDAGVEAINEERDDYHEFCVYYLKPNQLQEYRDGDKIVRIYKEKKEVKFKWIDNYGEG